MDEPLDERDLSKATQAAQPRPALDKVLRYLPFLAISNLLLSVPAILISVGVAYFTFVQAEATQKMQIASVWPYVDYETSNVGEDGERAVSMSLVNKGVGPAHIRGVEMTYGGKSYATFRELLADCCVDDPRQVGLGLSSVKGEVMRSGEELLFVSMSAKATPAETWARFNEERLKIRIRVCYCSVFDDCWINQGRGELPQPVAQCPADWKTYIGFPQAG